LSSLPDFVDPGAGAPADVQPSSASLDVGCGDHGEGPSVSSPAAPLENGAGYSSRRGTYKKNGDLC